MPASISLSHLTLCAPDGRSLLADLNLRFGSERTGLVGRNGVGKTTLLAAIAGEIAPRSGTISVNGTLGLFRQTVQANVDETLSDVFGARQALAVLRRAERGDATADELAEADWTLEARMEAALARVGLNMSSETPVTDLSGGQRTRASLAALIFNEPDFLLLDEPTNNLDRAGRHALYEWLGNWRAGAIVVSHDRELLDIMDCIVELTSLGATRYGGNWRFYREQKALQVAAARHDLADAEKQAADIERKTQIAVERQTRRDSAGRKKGAKGGTPRIVLGGLKERSENTGGSDARLADARRSQAAEAVAAARERLEVLQPLSVVLPSTGLPKGKELLRLQSVEAGYLPGHPVIRDLSLTLTGPERVAITGPNGSGKSTLLALVTGQLKPQAGTVHVMSAFAMLDQRVSLLDPSASIRDNFRRLNPQADENACRAALARFMFRADAALQRVDALSGGQVLRAGLACVLGGAKPPPLLILDEPTNHLDLDSVEAIEAGLRAYDGALLVVSHDEAFLTAIGISRRVALTETAPR